MIVGATSTLKAHIEKSCPKRHSVPDLGTRRSTSVSSFFSTKSDITNKPLSQRDVVDDALRFFISGNVPFNQAENGYFKKLFSSIKVNGKPASPPSRKAIRARLKDAASIAREKLKQELAENDLQVSLALDCWSSRTGHSYVGM